MDQKSLTKVVTVDPQLEHNLYEGDSRRIKQVLINLLSNSLKFTFQGSISIEVS